MSDFVTWREGPRTTQQGGIAERLTEAICSESASDIRDAQLSLVADLLARRVTTQRRVTRECGRCGCTTDETDFCSQCGATHGRQS